MALKVGIVGLPNAGKSTLFNALLKRQVAYAANYPFATIEPNVGVVPVADARLGELADIIEKSEGTRPPEIQATVEFYDIAGLVEGAAEGEGLGNKFLAHIREVDLICHVLRFFDDPDVVHVAGDVDHARDHAVIETELALADMQTLEKQDAPRKGISDKAAFPRWEVIGKLKTALDAGKQARDVLSEEEHALIRDLHLLTAKPVLFVGNVSEAQLADPPASDMSPIVYISAKIEAELASLSPEDQGAYLSELGLPSSGLDRLTREAYDMLGLMSFLTAGPKEVRAWTISRGTKARDAAGVIHTDFSDKFIKADVISYDDYTTLGGEHAAREAGKLRSEGKDYIVQDGDVIEFKFGS